MRHEKIIKRGDGSRVRILVEFTADFMHQETNWRFIVHHCPAGKRTWTTPVNHNEYAWRALTGPQRNAEDVRRCLTVATPDEIEQAMTELWQTMKPQFQDAKATF